MRKLVFTSGLVIATLFFLSCGQIIEPSIAHKTVTAEAPYEDYHSQNYTVSFWWDELQDALKYHLQVVKGTFEIPNELTLDTVITINHFAFNFSPGNYQWRVQALNSSSESSYSTPRDFTILQASITNQSMLPSFPTNSFQTNQVNPLLQRDKSYGATRYQLEIDTNSNCRISASSSLSKLAIGSKFGLAGVMHRFSKWLNNPDFMVLCRSLNLVFFRQHDQEISPAYYRLELKTEMCCT